MRTLTKASMVVPAAAAMLLASATGASAEDRYSMKLLDTMGNNSGSSSTADVTVDGDEMTIKIQGSGFTPNSPHAQHFHGSFDANKDFTCPTAADDADGDGQVNTEEGLPRYGDVMISLTTKGDTSAKSGLAVDRMPVADADGNLSYERTIALPAGAGAKLKNLHVVQHGLDANGNDKYDMEALGESSFATSLGVDGIPEEATNPATCGTVSGAAVGAAPTGGVDTGGGTTDGVESKGALGAGAFAILAAGAIVATRRRPATER
ncbi:hypothetical protein M3697_03970 [Janibacter melonis]|uniref:hypothetical protein n=1 Tax=Janibacter melonis TaxID=262209 RepID=UPI002043C0C7|nr:hypothetical protein [Janibacter melonis]MCM3554265.1 hypothetical protein [Janibacter melonis]